MKRAIVKSLLISTLAAICLAGASILLTQGSRENPRTLQEFLGPPEMSKVDPDKPLHEQTRIFELAGRRFEIPLMYIDGRPEPGEHQESMLLEVIWPEMRSIWELDDRAEYERLRKEEHRIGWILLHSSAARPPISTQVESRKRNIKKIGRIEGPDGLEGYLWYRGTSDQPEPWYEIYLELDSNEQILSVIDCSPPNRGPHPICEHKFIDNGLIYEITYNKVTYLQDWRNQQNSAIAFIDGLEVQPRSVSMEAR
jgi:hypothetical protein